MTENRQPIYKKLKARLKQLTGQVSFNKQLAGENFDKYLRALADLDNSRKRMAKEYLEKENEANRNLIAKLLPVLDNLERALATAQKSECQNEAGRTFTQGVEMIDEQFRKILEAEGLKHFDDRGAEFDPARHEAILAIETDAHPPNTVLDVVEQGFLFNGKVLRPARVTVSKQNAAEPESQAKADAARLPEEALEQEDLSAEVRLWRTQEESGSGE
ncbi:MAG: nucleotide exchange factor GrpE [Candidatus Edwardsbacteria bacterium]|nr:nucleotide exchange factor GrpE [Candidatus Edwardsbacteria bacterium]